MMRLIFALTCSLALSVRVVKQPKRGQLASIDEAAPNYKQSEQGGGPDCPSGSRKTTEDECKEAAAEFAGEFRWTNSWGNAPSGCFTDVEDNTFFYNLNVASFAHPYLAVVCRSEEPVAPVPRP